MRKLNFQQKITQKKAIIALIVVFICAFASGVLTGQSLLPRQAIFDGIFFLPTNNFDQTLFLKVWDSIKGSYIQKDISDQDLFYGSLKGMVSGLEDPYSVFLDPELAKKFLSEMSGDFEGVGIEIGIKNNRLTIIAPLPNTPAARAGLRPGDKIYAVDEKDTNGMSLDEVATLIRGKKGTPVILTIFREEEKESRDIEVVRAKITIRTVSWELLEDEKSKIAHIKLSHFSNNTENDFKKISQVVLRSNPDGIILDLRSNPGGYLDTSVDIAGYWLGEKVVVVSKDRQESEKQYHSNGQSEFQEIPTIVLINQGSASASEILAGALQDYHQATILGEKSFGKGSVQELERFFDGSALKLTIAYWYTPEGRSIDEHGIDPDIEVEMTAEDYDQDRDPQLDKALEILRK